MSLSEQVSQLKQENMEISSRNRLDREHDQDQITSLKNQLAQQVQVVVCPYLASNLGGSQ